MNKKALLPAVFLCLIFCLTGCFLIETESKNETETRRDGLIYEQFQGEVLSYEETDEGVIITMTDMYSLGKKVHVIVSDEASISYPETEEIRRVIDERQVGIILFVHSEFYQDVEYSAYPATVLDLVSRPLPQSSPSGQNGFGISGVLSAQLSYDPDTANQLSLTLENRSSEKSLYMLGSFLIEHWDGENWVNCTPGNFNAELPSIELLPASIANENTTLFYDITDFDLSKSGTYRLVTYYSRSEELNHPVALIVEFRHSKN